MEEEPEPSGRRVDQLYVTPRGTAAHNAGAQDLHTETKWVSDFGFKGLEITYPPALHMAAGIGATKHAVGIQVPYFETGSGCKELIPTCDDYLALLARQI